MLKIKISLDQNLDAYSIDPKEVDELGNAYILLAQYAKTKAAAMRLRLEGMINAAIMQEERCNSIYQRIPGKFKQW